MIDRALLSAFHPPRTQILQVRLRHFSLGHLVTLQYLQSPLLGESGDTFTAFDVFIAVLICSRTWSECQEFVSDPEDWTKKVHAWIEKVGPVNIVEKAAEFRRYVMDGSVAPAFEAPERSGGFRAPGIPIEQQMRLRLLGHGMSEADVMNRPLTLCWWDYLTLLESDGACRVLTGEAVDFDNEMFALADKWATETSE